MMRELTGFEVEGAETGTKIEVVDEPGPGGANHHYFVNTPEFELAEILFQRGPVKEFGVNGVTHEQLLAIVADRLRSFQAGPYPSKDNAAALDHIEQAIARLHWRTKDRLARGVEGRTAA